MEAGVHADDLADDVVVGTANFLVTFLPFLAAGAPETPPEGTVVALRGATVDLRLCFAGGRWSAADANDTISPADPPAAGDATAVIEAEDDSTVLRFALGRLSPDDPRLVLSGHPRPGHA